MHTIMPARFPPYVTLPGTAHRLPLSLARCTLGTVNDRMHSSIFDHARHTHKDTERCEARLSYQMLRSEPHKEISFPREAKQEHVYLKNTCGTANSLELIPSRAKKTSPLPCSRLTTPEHPPHPLPQCWMQGLGRPRRKGDVFFASALDPQIIAQH